MTCPPHARPAGPRPLALIFLLARFRSESARALHPDPVHTMTYLPALNSSTTAAPPSSPLRPGRVCGQTAEPLANATAMKTPSQSTRICVVPWVPDRQTETVSSDSDAHVPEPIAVAQSYVYAERGASDHYRCDHNRRDHIAMTTTAVTTIAMTTVLPQEIRQLRGISPD